jgi:uncharacterized membrane protein YjgN (DUF898 family)
MLLSKKIVFTGGFGEYFLISLGLLLLSVITFGLATPYWLYWSFKYFFANLEYGGTPVRFTGSFGEYFLISLGLLILSVLTFGLALPYYAYWSLKYFFTNMEIPEQAVDLIQH